MPRPKLAEDTQVVNLRMRTDDVTMLRTAAYKDHGGNLSQYIRSILEGAILDLHEEQGTKREFLI